MSLDFKSSLDDSPYQAALGRMGKSAAATASAIGSAFTTIGVGLGVGSILAFGKSMLDTAGEVSDASAALGISGERLQGLQAAFGTAGVSAETFRSGMTKAADSLDELRTKDGPAREALEKLGLSFKDVADSSLDEFLLQVSEGFARSTDKGAALTAVVGLLGKGGKQMAAGMAEGREQIEGIANAAEVMKNQTLKDFDELADHAELKTKAAANSVANFVHDAWADFRKDLEGLRGALNPKDSRFNMNLPVAKDAPFLGPENQGSRQDPRIAKEHADMLKREADDEKEYTDILNQEFEKRWKDGDDKLKFEADQKQQFIQAEIKAEEEKTKRLKELNDDLNDALGRSDKARFEAAKKNIQDLEAEAQSAAQNDLKAQANLAGFNRMTPDERRNSNRADRAERLAEGRERRMGGNVTDTRSGSRRRAMEAFEAARDAALAKNKAEAAKLALDAATINALAAAIAKENDKLIMAP